MRKVICAGIPRSGSTLLYNLCRLSLVSDGYQAAGHVSTFSRTSRLSAGSAPFVLKTHDVDAGVACDPDYLVVQSWRDIDSVARSARRIWGLSDSEIRDLLAVASARYESLANDGALCFSHSSLVGDPGAVISQIRSAVGLEDLGADQLRAILERADGLQAGDFERLRKVGMRIARSASRMRLGARARAVGVPPKAVQRCAEFFVRPDPETLMLPGHRSSKSASVEELPVLISQVRWPSKPLDDGNGQ